MSERAARSGTPSAHRAESFARSGTRSAQRVLVAGVGNIFNADDGFGSAVVAELQGTEIPPGARVVDYGIRGVHLAFDLADGVELLVLVDTVADAGAGPGSVAVIEVAPGSIGTATLDAHDLDPNAVFMSLGALGTGLPRTLVVGCQPLSTEEGIGLTDPVAAAVPVAADKVLQLLRQELGDPR
jgi:hydrogenase maturation protease